jgi:hypothetical protein
VVSILGILSGLAARGVRISAVGDRLRVEAPSGVLTEELRQILADRKPELLKVLREPTSQPPVALTPETLPREWKPVYEELIATHECQWRQHREHAEARALTQVTAMVKGGDGPTTDTTSPQSLIRAPGDYEEADIAVLEWLEGLREAVVLRPTDRVPRNSDSPEGWAADSWRERLQQLAEACESVSPFRAAELRGMAEELT